MVTVLFVAGREGYVLHEDAQRGRPGSLKTVGQGLAAEHGGVITFRITSDSRKADAVVPAVSELTMSITGASLDVTTSPHDAVAAAATASPAPPNETTHSHRLPAHAHWFLMILGVMKISSSVF